MITKMIAAAGAVACLAGTAAFAAADVRAPADQVFALPKASLTHGRSGRIEEAKGSVELKVLHDIATEHVDLRLERRQQLPHRVFWWERVNVTGHDFSGALAGSEVTLHVHAECRNITNWRLIVYFSPGKLADGTIIIPGTFAYPHDRGRELNCVD